VAVEEADFEEPPDTLRGESRKLIRGAFKLRDRLLLILDVAHATKAAAAGRS
jgi:purine-binding chemotaxis protein CheW